MAKKTYTVKPLDWISKDNLVTSYAETVFGRYEVGIMQEAGGAYCYVDFDTTKSKRQYDGYADSIKQGMAKCNRDYRAKVMQCLNPA